MRLRPFSILALTFALPAFANAITPGAAAPDFKGTDANGQTQTLSQYHGKYVVLEWANQGCPYDRKHYLSGSMEALQKQWTSEGRGMAERHLLGPGPAGLCDADRGERLPAHHACVAVSGNPRSKRSDRQALCGKDHAAHVRD